MRSPYTVHEALTAMLEAWEGQPTLKEQFPAWQESADLVEYDVDEFLLFWEHELSHAIVTEAADGSE
jgi:hypothetical protein